MGYHIILQVTCQVLPEFVPLIRERYLRGETDWEPDDSVPNSYKPFIRTWKRLAIGCSFGKHDITADGIFTCYIEKKPYNHRGDLWTDYEEFLKHIIVPISSKILSCTISEDDCTMREEVYTDAQLRNIQFRLGDLVDHVEHVYEEGVIVETRVIWKRGFSRELELDVTRMFR